MKCAVNAARIVRLLKLVCVADGGCARRGACGAKNDQHHESCLRPAGSSGRAPVSPLCQNVRSILAGHQPSYTRATITRRAAGGTTRRPLRRDADPSSVVAWALRFVERIANEKSSFQDSRCIGGENRGQGGRSINIVLTGVGLMV